MRALHSHDAILTRHSATDGPGREKQTDPFLDDGENDDEYSNILAAAHKLMPSRYKQLLTTDSHGYYGDNVSHLNSSTARLLQVLTIDLELLTISGQDNAVAQGNPPGPVPD